VEKKKKKKKKKKKRVSLPINISKNYYFIRFFFYLDEMI